MPKTERQVDDLAAVVPDAALRDFAARAVGSGTPSRRDTRVKN